MRTRVSLLLLVVIGVLLWAVPSAAGDRHIASGPYLVESLSAYGGVVAWGSSHSYFSSAGGSVARLGISAPRGGALASLDLGPGRTRGIVAAYARCKSSGDESGPTGCDVYRYAFGSRHAEPVPGASTRRWEEGSPSTWRGRVVFERSGTEDGAPCDPPFRGCGTFATNPLTLLIKRQLLYEPDLRGRVVAFLGFGSGDIFVKRFDRRGRGRACRIARSRGGSRPAPGDLDVNSPQLDGRYVYWTRMAPGEQNGVSTGISTVSEGRRLLPSRTCRPRGREERTSVLLRVGPRPGDTFDSYFRGFAVARGRLYYVTTKQSYSPPYPYQSDIWETQPHFATP